MLARDAFTPLLQLTLTLLNPRSCTHARHHEGQKSDDDQGHDNDGDNGAGSHRVPPFTRWGCMEGFPTMHPDQTAPAFDLQSHSTHSDGSLAPAEVVARAAA